MRTTALIALLVLVALPALANAPKDMATYWRESGLGLPELETWVNDQACLTNRETFLGCVAAVNSLLAAQRPALELAVQATPQNVAVVTHPATSLETSKQARLAARDAWANVYDRHVEISFTALAHKALTALAQRDNQAQLIAGAINAYLSVAKDPHTYILPRAHRNTPDAGEFSGIGIDLQVVQGELTVLKPREESPALAAGIRTGDVIETVDGVAMNGLTLDEAITHIRGAVGTPVQLAIRRHEQVIELKVIRQKIINRNVTFKTLSDHNALLGYIRLNTFEDAHSCAAVNEAITTLATQNVTGLIFDLRNNLGGLVDQAVCITSLFAGPYKAAVFLYAQDVLTDMMGTEMWTHYATPQYFAQYTNRALATELPLVVLINGYSASASEILAGALQDFKRALIIGDRSYGKGTFQQPQELPGNSEVTLMATGGRFYLPTKRTNQIVGIQPDLLVYNHPIPTPEDRTALREEDLYTNAFAPQGDAWVQPRPEEIERIRRCVEVENFAQKFFTTHLADAILPEYQVLYAEEALNCVLRPHAKPESLIYF